MPSRPFTPATSAALLLALAVLAAYAGVIGCGFISYDDPLYVEANSHVRAGLTWHGVRWALTTLHAGLWIPLTWLSLMVDTALFGTAPWGYHLTNLLLHLASTLLLFGWLLGTTARLGPSFVVAGLFGLHPLHVESVAWVAERKDVLSTLLLMLMLWRYQAWVTAPSRRRWAEVLALFGLALLAKPMLATVPLVLLAIDVWPLRRPTAGTRAAVVEKLPLFAVAALVTVVTVIAQRQSGGVAPLSELPMDERIATATTGYVWYLTKTLWPTNLAPLYPYDHFIPAWQTLGSAILLAGVTAAAIVAGRRHPYLAVGWLWFVVMLAPVSGLVQNGVQRYADRFVYVPHIGLFIAVVWGAADLAARWRLSDRVPAGVAVIVLLACLGATRAQVAWWENGVTVFERTVAVTSGNASAHVLLGLALAARGERGRALVEYQRALAIDPQHAGARAEIGSSDIEDHRQAAYRLMAAGDTAGAIRRFAEAVRLAPDDPGLRTDHANALALSGRIGDAIVVYREVLARAPNDAQTHMNLANALYLDRQVDAALAEYEQALRLDPTYAEAHYNLGVVLEETGERSEAVEHFRAAVRLKPDYSEAQARLQALSVHGR